MSGDPGPVYFLLLTIFFLLGAIGFVTTITLTIALNNAYNGKPQADRPRIWGFIGPYEQFYFLKWIWSGRYRRLDSAFLAFAVWLQRLVHIAGALYFVAFFTFLITGAHPRR